MKMTAFSALFFLTSLFATAQNIEPIKLDKLSELTSSSGSEASVINFWASWCGPCVKELPYFDKLSDNPNVKVHLVSVDFIQDKEKAESLLIKKHIKSSSFLLDEKNFVEKVDESWSGAIPATLIIDKKGQRHFYEKAFSEEELFTLVNNIISK